MNLYIPCEWAWHHRTANDGPYAYTKPSQRPTRSATLHPAGVIMLDDAYNAKAPGMMLALGHFLTAHRDTHTLFAYGRNKHYVSRVGAARRHQDVLKRDCGKISPRGACDVHVAVGPWNPSTRGDLVDLSGHFYRGQWRHRVSCVHG